MENLPVETKASHIWLHAVVSVVVDTLPDQVEVVSVVHAVLYNTSTTQYSRQGSTRRAMGPGMEHAHQRLTATIMTLSGLKQTGTSERVDIRHGPVPPTQPKPNPKAC